MYEPHCLLFYIIPVTGVPGRHVVSLPVLIDVLPVLSPLRSTRPSLITVRRVTSNFIDLRTTLANDTTTDATPTPSTSGPVLRPLPTLHRVPTQLLFVSPQSLGHSPGFVRPPSLSNNRCVSLATLRPSRVTGLSFDYFTQTSYLCPRPSSPTGNGG